MGREWTHEQKKVIASTGRNLLVSAAAGSGKTAVLVERIIRMITDSGNPVDIDKLVIITFTRAAAAQMRQKISSKLEDLIEKEPENTLYRRQHRLLGNAVISTIDSFCLNIVRAYFQKLEIDPSFRIADDTELKLIESDAMDELMEKYHEEGSEGFFYLIEAYCGYKTDEKLISSIKQLASKAQAQPWPEKWLSGLITDYKVGDGTALDASQPVRGVYRHCLDMIKGILNKVGKAVKLCSPDMSGDITGGYLAVLSDDEKKLLDLLKQDSFSKLGEALRALSFKTLTCKKGGDETAKNNIKNIRNKYKSEISGLIKNFFSIDSDSAAGLITKSEPAVTTLVNMTKEYLSILNEKKREKNVIDFMDAEHFALDILYGDTPEALELRGQYREIIIDEYQDSNNLQEYIANAIAGDCGYRPFIFTVGDVKQSIYKFRNARPELFMEKQKRYGGEEDNGELIILDNNFRSREEVLDSTNAVFGHIMREELGGIEYNEACSLKKGTARQDSLGERSPYKTEVLIVSKILFGDEEDPKNTEDTEDEKRTVEARLIARRIKKLIYEEKTEIFDEEEKNGSRPVRYSDIVILLRTMKDWSSVFTLVLEEEGIPVFTEESQGFFKSTEVRLAIDFLSILDNPRQDIPFTAVLHSVIGGFSEEELALVRVYAAGTESFYDAVCKIRDLTKESGGKEDGFRLLTEATGITGIADEHTVCQMIEKAGRFMELYNGLEEYRKSASVSELIEKIYGTCDLYNYYSALPDGEVRKANLDMLPVYAVKFEETSYSGLFSFIRYYEKLQERELDYGEAGAKAAGNCVRIMSIHKSKGLEFPVVFASGLGKEFNFKEFSGDICISSDYGIGIKYVDTEKRVRYPSLYHSIIKMKGTEDIIGEEMRLLYVAMTRAKEKLILTGSAENVNEGTDYANLYKAKKMLDFVYPVLDLEKEYFDVTIVSPGRVKELKDFLGSGSEETTGHDLQDPGLEIEADDLTERLKEARSKEYPYRNEEAVPVKMSVSDLKHMEIEEEFGENMFEETREFVPGDRTVPDFLRKEEVTRQGTAYGTLVHKCMRFMDFTIRDEEGVKAFLLDMEKSGRIKAQEMSMIPLKRIVRLLNSGLADRIRQACLKGQFYREKQFMYSIPAKDIDPEKYALCEVPVPIQGVIDAMFVEDGRLVILDYKTDHLDDGEEEKLVTLYRKQLDLYGEAAEKLMGIPVGEKLLYSFSLEKTIAV